jgi:hypothetical protein
VANSFPQAFRKHHGDSLHVRIFCFSK